MSLIFHIYYKGENGAARSFAEEMTESGLVEGIRSQAGNEKYAYYFPKEDEETVLLIDAWTDQAAIDAHHKSEWMPQIAALRKKYKLRMKVESYLTPDEVTSHES